MSDNKKLESWLTAEFCKDRPEGKPLRKFVLRTAAPGTKGSDVDDFKIDARIELDEIPVWASQIMARAQDDADGRGPGTYQYVVLAMLKGEEKPVARFTMRVAGNEDLDLDEDGTNENAPNMKGLMSQLMRHNESYARALAMMTAQQVASAVRRQESAERTVERLLDERMKMYETLEQSRSQQHDRDMDLMLADSEQKRKDAVFGKIMQLMPLVVNKMMGSKVLPDKSDPLMMILEPLIDSMGAEQFKAIQQALTPEQTLMFVELLQTFQKRKELQPPKEN